MSIYKSIYLYVYVSNPYFNNAFQYSAVEEKHVMETVQQKFSSVCFQVVASLSWRRRKVVCPQHSSRDKSTKSRRHDQLMIEPLLNKRSADLEIYTSAEVKTKSQRKIMEKKKILKPKSNNKEKKGKRKKRISLFLF